jgi:hypothetical protein
MYWTTAPHAGGSKETIAVKAAVRVKSLRMVRLPSFRILAAGRNPGPFALDTIRSPSGRITEGRIVGILTDFELS